MRLCAGRMIILLLAYLIVQTSVANVPSVKYQSMNARTHRHHQPTREFNNPWVTDMLLHMWDENLLGNVILGFDYVLKENYFPYQFRIQYVNVNYESWFLIQVKQFALRWTCFHGQNIQLFWQLYSFVVWAELQM